MFCLICGISCGLGSSILERKCSAGVLESGADDGDVIPEPLFVPIFSANFCYHAFQRRISGDALEEQV